MAVREVPINSLAGTRIRLREYAGTAMLIVNVASECGLTGQYTALERLHRDYRARGFTVLGVPCNQFYGQEPGDPVEIAEFCSTRFDVTFPMTEKVEVNGQGRHPLYDGLVEAPDADGYRGDIRWNFEKFLVTPDDVVAARFAPTVEPDSPEVRAAIERVLPR